MLDIGWPELLVVAIVLIVVVGPKDLPPMLRAFGRTTKKLRGMASEFRGQFDEALREAELDDVKQTFSDAKKLNPMQSIRDAVNPLKDTARDIRSDLEKSVKPVAVPDSGMKLEGDPKIESDRAVEAEPLKGPVETAEAPTKTTPAAKTTAAAKSDAGKSPAKPAANKPAAKAASKPAAKSPAKPASKAGSAKTAAKPAASKSAAGKTTTAKPAAAKPATRKASTTAKKTSRKTSDKA